MKQLEDDKLREEFFYKQLFQSGFFCHFCRLSQQMLRCDILMDQTSCNKHICVRCYKNHRTQACEGGHTYQDHYNKDRKVRLSTKLGLSEEANKLFYKEHKVRSNDQFKTLEYDFVNLMAYLQMNPVNTQSRNSYTTVEHMVVKSLGDKKKQERKLLNEGIKRKKAVYLNQKDQHLMFTGIDSCGYNRKHQKGINLILNAFSSSHPKEEQLIKPPKQTIGSKLPYLLQPAEVHKPKISSFSLLEPQSKKQEGNSILTPPS